jgi:hypothetical protein
VEVLRVAYEEGSASGVPAWEKKVGAPPQMGAVGANAAPRVDGSRVKEVEPRSEDALGPMALTPSL